MTDNGGQANEPTGHGWAAEKGDGPFGRVVEHLKTQEL